MAARQLERACQQRSGGGCGHRWRAADCVAQQRLVAHERLVRDGHVVRVDVAVALRASAVRIGSYV